jgi:serine/threonine protein kinase
MSPEQCMAGEVDRRSDLYSLGVMLFEMLSGHAPFEDELPLRLLSRQISELPPPLTAPEPIPAALDRIVSQLLDKEPARRPARALDVLEVLLDLLEAPERKSALGLEVGSSDDTLANLPPFDQFEPETTVRDMELPAGMQEEELEEDRTVPWISPFGLQSITLRDFGASPSAGDEPPLGDFDASPTMPERKGK